MKKLLLLTALCLPALSGAAWAQNSNYQNRMDTNSIADSDLTGPYLGADLGYTFGSFDTDIGGVSNDTGMDGLQGGVLVGYGFQFDPSFLSYFWSGYTGLELGYQWSGVDGDAFGVGIDKKDSWSITFRPGMTWGDVALGYGIIGYSRTEFEAGGESEDLDGLVLGAGTELGDMGPFKTRLEYVYTNYEDADFGGPGVDFDGHDSTIKLGAVFHF